ncbi:MAG: hypothetical protein H7258_04735 [Ferruginibacter sp.]|nr:hypothetical protein [Ferruginibacter sp.]
MEQYNIILSNERAATHRYVTLLIIVINLLLSGFIFFTTSDHRVRNLSFGAMLVCSFALVTLFITRKSNKKYTLPVMSSFLILAILWLLVGKYILALSISCFAVIGFYTVRKLTVTFSEEGILYPSFPKKLLLWKDISNVLLKDDMLTIDFKNNMLIQALISKESPVSESDFNLFCKKYIV